MGNPFFAIEILRHLVESQKIITAAGHWSTPGEIGDLAMPTTASSRRSTAGSPDSRTAPVSGSARC